MAPKCKPDEILVPAGTKLVCVKRPTVPQSWIDTITRLLDGISDPIGGGKRALKKGAVYLLIAVVAYHAASDVGRRIAKRVVPEARAVDDYQRRRRRRR